MNYKNILIIFMLIFSFVGCGTTPILNKKNKKTKIRTISKMKFNNCFDRIKYFRLLSKIATNKTKLSFLKENTASDLCTKYYPQTTKFINEHRGKIGIIFEKKIETEEKDHAILAGIVKAAKQNMSMDMFVVKKVKLNNKSVNKALSSLVFRKKVGLIITWGDKRLVSRIQRWQKGLNIPTLFIDKNIEKSKTSFKIFPNKKNYSLKMARTMKEKGIKRIVILTPIQYEKSDFLKTIKETFKKNKIKIVHDLTYNPDDYTSMDIACRRIFQINRQTRWSELQDITRKERRMAKAKGFKLNKKLVFLPAKVNYDAIFIPDNFKMVHHFVKLFQYYQAPKIPLIGTHEWRSSELMKTNTDFLRGSSFIDFIGNPEDLPILSKKEIQEIDPKESLGRKIDFKLMGYYTAIIGQMAINKSNMKRIAVNRDLKKLKVNDKFLKNKRAFKNNEFNWPSFSFELGDNEFFVKEKKTNKSRKAKRNKVSYKDR